MPKMCFFPEKKLKGIFVYIVYLNVEKNRNMRPEHFECHQTFNTVRISSVYQVFWFSDRVIDCNILILFRFLTTGPEQPIYRTKYSVDSSTATNTR